MYKDPRGNYISKNSVVLVGEYLYTVIGFDNTRECSILLANGRVYSQCKPEDLICVNGMSDLSTIDLKG
jgi:hypothetical protein